MGIWGSAFRVSGLDRPARTRSVLLHACCMPGMPARSRWGKQVSHDLHSHKNYTLTHALHPHIAWRHQVELCSSNQGQTVALTSTGLVLEWGQLGGGVEAGGGGSLTPQQVQAILSGAVPGGGGAGGKEVGGSPPKELSGLSKRSVERIECGRRHFCLILRGTHAQSCVASGKALSEAVAGRREKFKIKAFSACGEPMAQGAHSRKYLLQWLYIVNVLGR